MKIPSIGIAISCYNVQIKYLNRLFDSIQSQTVHPQIVVVCCSLSIEDDLNKEFDDTCYSFPFKILINPLYRNNAQNRNEASIALDTDIISYVDVDSIMHPQCIECIRECFTHVKHSKILIHRYSENEHFEKINGFEFINDNLIKNERLGCVLNDQILKNNYYEKLNLGNCSIRNDVFKKIRFTEEESLQSRINVLFVKSVLERYPYQNTYCTQVLSKYVIL